MTDQNSHDNEKWEAKINALLEGDLGPEESESLKSAASDDRELARAIIESYQLQRAMEHVQVEKAPASLTRKLKKIPRQHRPVYLQPRWAMAFAAVPLLIVSVALLRTVEQPGSQVTPVTPQQAIVQQTDPDQADINKAAQDLAVAFTYIDQVSDRTRNRIETEVGGGMSQAVAGSIFKTIQHQKIL